MRTMHMAEIKLFRLNSTVEELKPSEVALERNLQTCIEKNMQAFFGVRFLRLSLIHIYR